MTIYNSFLKGGKNSYDFITENKVFGEKIISNGFNLLVLKDYENFIFNIDDSTIKLSAKNKETGETIIFYKMSIYSMSLFASFNNTFIDTSNDKLNFEILKKAAKCFNNSLSNFINDIEDIKYYEVDNNKILDLDDIMLNVLRAVKEINKEYYK